MVIKDGKYLFISTEGLSQDVLYTLYDLFGEPENNNPIVASLTLFESVLKFDDIQGNVLKFFEEVVWEGLKRGADLIVLK